MQHDEVIWQTIRHNHCSYMAKITTGIFCRNENNVTGICNRSSCPLANSRYATIRDHDGVFYLYMKSIERAHTPNKLWERVKLPRNYEKALEIIDNNLLYWPKFLVHKTKQRLTKMTQMRIRMRKLQLKVREKIMTVPRKEKKREARREEKAEKAAVLDKNIEKELLARLEKGVYGDLYNINGPVFKKILDELELNASTELEEEPELEYVEGDFKEEEDMEDFGDFVKDETLRGNDEDSDLEDAHARCSGKKRKGFDTDDAVKGAVDALSTKLKGKGKVLVEVENDDDTAVKQKLRH